MSNRAGQAAIRLYSGQDEVYERSGVERGILVWLVVFSAHSGRDGVVMDC